jgi:hypothetical protein
MTKTTLTILIIGTLLQSCGQPTSQRGLLLLDNSRNHTSFDLFLPYEFDETKTLEENIKSIKWDTANWVSLSIVDNYDDLIDHAKKIENEGNETMSDNVRYIRVIPVEIEIDKSYDGRQSDDTDFGEYEIKFYGKVITPGYDARQVLTLSKAQIIKME